MSKLSMNTQYKVWKKTDGKCAYCGCQMVLPESPEADEFVPLQFSIDHALPQVHGGTNELSNLLPACRSCNSSKNHKTVEEYRESLTWQGIGKFSATQIRWLNHHGIELPKPPHYEFYFESIGLGSK